MKLYYTFLALLVTGCSYNGTTGLRDQIEVSTRSELFAPSVTIVVDNETGKEYVFSGSSIMGQLSGPAAVAVGMDKIGSGMRKSGTNVTNNNVGDSSSGSSSYSDSSSSSTIYK